MTTSDTDQQQKRIPVLPYTYIIGQDKLKLALELAYVAPRIGGVLISGQRGTAKSTIARAFADMVYDRLPVTIPINATEDRVVGGWKINKLVHGELEKQEGLLQEADGTILYVDEINLLDDHIVNIILDATSSGILVIERDGRDEQVPVQFTLVGTMNPEEGGLRPQLLDRFGLMVQVEAPMEISVRQQILDTILKHDQALAEYKQNLLKKREASVPFFNDAHEELQEHKKRLEKAHREFYKVVVPDEILALCARIAQHFQVEGMRGDFVMALGAKAHAALAGREETIIDDVLAVAGMALRHRMPQATQLSYTVWGQDQEDQVAKIARDAEHHPR